MLRSPLLINKLPFIYELEDIMEYCKKHKYIYIYGRGEQEEYLLKYLDMCNIRVEGYCVTHSYKEMNDNFKYKEKKVRALDELPNDNSMGVIVGLGEKYYGEVIPLLRKKKYQLFIAKRIYKECVM